ncbi:MAG: hypothetical protein RLZZ15_4126 [Verrucomicrobiota bacterium]|jgi:hypothetical protein
MRPVPRPQLFRAPVLNRAVGVLLAVVFALFAGCSTTHSVKVNAVATPKAEELISYEIHNRNPAVADDSLRFREAAERVRTALSGKGLFEAPPGVKPDLTLEVDYGVGPPQAKTETISEPVYRTIPGRVVTERVQVGTDRNGNPVYQTVTVQEPPTTEFAGYREYQVQFVIYEKYLKLSARKNAPDADGRAAAEGWSLDVITEGESRDIRKALPILAAASIDYIGKDSQGEKVIRLKDNARDIGFVKKGMGAEAARAEPPPESP